MMRPYDPHRPVIFAHIPKCAGTSFIRLLRQWFGDRYHHPHVNEREAGTTLPALSVKDADGNWRSDVGCIHAHFDHGRGFGLPDQFPDVEQYFSFVRDPFDIVVSMYFFAKGKSARGAYFYDGRQVDIRDQFPSVEHYVKEHPGWLYNHLPQDLSLENFEELIPQRFVYLGVFEEMEESIRRLAGVLGKPAIDLPQHNRSIYDEPVPEKLRNVFYDEHPMLKGIHELARRNFREHEPSKLPSKTGQGVKKLFASLLRK